MALHNPPIVDWSKPGAIGAIAPAPATFTTLATTAAPYSSGQSFLFVRGSTGGLTLAPLTFDGTAFRPLTSNGGVGSLTIVANRQFEAGLSLINSHVNGRGLRIDLPGVTANQPVIYGSGDNYTKNWSFWFNPSMSLLTLDSVKFGVLNTTASTAPNNGALTVNGGMGVGGALNAGGTISGTMIRPGSYTVATVPTASANAGAMIYVSNEIGGGTIAFSDGTTWRRVHDREVIS
ncbi:hypothetical protein [Myxacorys almedinensis]|uniref:Uncharacterized protein n=1 Tax=Myxacorys almedinensis A TaxID=2690445 RepID=A0A8J8CHJ4_9CYAN|nr:hypothetical protein [Myxacorys almedinensis]NDJ16788.1 hypothetical protein [Myxacorys almedinensis A]